MAYVFVFSTVISNEKISNFGVSQVFHFQQQQFRKYILYL